MHSAKGQKWDSVHGATPPTAPPERTQAKTEAELEEVRRLLYVAMMRAKNELSLLAPARYDVTRPAALGERHCQGASIRFLILSVLACFE